VDAAGDIGPWLVWVFPLATALASLRRARNLANGAALQASVQNWRDQIDALQRLADVQSYTAVNPRQPLGLQAPSSALHTCWRRMVMAEKKMTEAAVLALVEEEKIMASRGVELLGTPLQDFLALMHAHGLTLCDDTPQDIKQDLDDVRKVLKKNAQR